MENEHPAKPDQAPPLDPAKRGIEQVTAPVARKHIECPHQIDLRVVIDDHRTAESRGSVETLSLPCERWTCPHCGPRKMSKYIAHFSQHFARRPNTFFCTLTLDPKIRIPPEESRSFIVHRWSRFRKRIQRRAEKISPGSRIEFLATVEWQKQTRLAHLHVILYAPGIEPLTLADQWFASGGGAVCDIQRIPCAIERRECVAYCIKYALKEATSRPTKNRRYVLCSESCGYYSQAARERRRNYAARNMENDTERIPPSGESVEYIPLLRGHRRIFQTRTKNPDTPTAEQIERWENLDYRARTSRYRYKDRKSGKWYQITQTDEGRRMTPLHASYTSPIERALQKRLD